VKPRRRDVEEGSGAHRVVDPGLSPGRALPAISRAERGTKAVVRPLHDQPPSRDRRKVEPPVRTNARCHRPAIGVPLQPRVDRVRCLGTRRALRREPRGRPSTRSGSKTSAHCLPAMSRSYACDRAPTEGERILARKTSRILEVPFAHPASQSRPSAHHGATPARARDGGQTLAESAARPARAGFARDCTQGREPLQFEASRRSISMSPGERPRFSRPRDGRPDPPVPRAGRTRVAKTRALPTVVRKPLRRVCVMHDDREKPLGSTISCTSRFRCRDR